ncbi:RING-H2 finger protein ATL67 isoform X2 [Rosa chinensis]|uniref:RING-H2 finger protein ATL67 isoform X2 n=1 Tax=Rosa chinensis TaxID=74649 RepID=UPI001AD94094|nr:RING-H2 finger protein ATL67 isoform X2 [Rosa chinensis]
MQQLGAPYNFLNLTPKKIPMAKTPSSLHHHLLLLLQCPPSLLPSSNYLTTLGLGYAIAIALGFLVLLSTLLLASYICCRVSRHHRSQPQTQTQNPNSSSEGVILPRIIFVAEDDVENQENDDENSVVGLHQNVINSYPKFPFSKEIGGGDASTCSICLCDYHEFEMLRMMPECRHHFHLLCLDAWLKLNGSCPVCRNSPLPTPLSTPLQEVVPLSQHAADRRWRREDFRKTKSIKALRVAVK